MIKQHSFCFTRHLYARDEVEASLLTALLKRDDLCEAYFWAYELHYSGFDIFTVIWRIYYDIYFELNPGLERYITKKQSVWVKKNDANVIAYCVKNMFLSEPSSKVFVLRQLALCCEANVNVNANANAKPSTIGCYRGRKPKWCEKHPKKYQQWLRAISKGDYIAIAHHTYILVHNDNANTDEMFAELAVYFSDTFDIDPEVFSYWNARKYVDDAHYLLSITVYLLEYRSNNYGENISESNTTFRPRDIHLEMFEEFGKDIFTEFPSYCILERRRLYAIRPTIGGFNLARNNDTAVCNYDHIYQANTGWEQFVFETPYWVRRFDSVGASYDETNKRVSFPSDDAREEFYEKYCYEPDEQSRAVRDRSLGEIPIGTWKTWYESVFTEPSIVNFGEEHRFHN